ncbi:GNAT family N-acetyltransferase [Terrimonas sp. NA20]|uniref:GNAT family N-acetyltransferase n=1 Tax=Terrimonas ginsenosidimutans TaxID=2908004 RepID=A0ABS9KYN9_9BACT|nr:GNAT family N-acetyltransferase [Terrimonas ginsenosidimutans]MCG2617398.1 GNAT family N-acetyltransferase [Terrimonas ginsenosidimutans]
MDIRSVDLETIWKIRQEVMYPAEELNYVQLPDDGSGRHLGLYAGDVLVSIVSLFERGDDLQFRKFATLTREQGKGYGSDLLQYVMDLGVAEGRKSIWCNARVAASGFYEKFGMYTTGGTWWTKDIEFVKMEKQFN